MAGLVPAIYVLFHIPKTSMPGTGPGIMRITKAVTAISQFPKQRVAARHLYFSGIGFEVELLHHAVVHEHGIAF